MYGHRLVRELLGLLFLFCGLLMLLSLWSYHAGDPTFNRAVSMDASAVQNSAGLFGSYLAGFLVDCFGIASFLWVIFFLAVGAGLVSRWLVLKWYRWIGYLMLFSCVLVAASTFDVSLHGIHGGGLGGQWLSAFSYLFFSPVGSFLLWLFVFLIAMELSFSISWLTLLSAAFAWVMKKIPSFGTTYDLPVPHLPRALSRLSGMAAGWGRQHSGNVRPRAVLDIVFGRRKDADEPATPAPVLEIKMPEMESGPKKAPEPEQAPTDSGIRDEDLSDLLRLVEHPQVPENRGGASDEEEHRSGFAAQAVSLGPDSEEKDVSGQIPVPDAGVNVVPVAAQEEDEFILELEDPVETPEPAASQPATPDLAASPVIENSPAAWTSEPAAAPVAESVSVPDSSVFATTVPTAVEPAEEELSPSALAALSAPAPAVSAEDFPAVVLASPVTAQPVQPVPSVPVASFSQAPARENEPAQSAPVLMSRTASSFSSSSASEHRDAAYASVNAAVAGAMAEQKEIEAAAAPAAPASVLPKRRKLMLPSLDLLSPLPEDEKANRPDEMTLARQGNALITCLKNFNVNATLARITPGPVVTMFEVRPAPGVKATRITNLANDLAMSLKAVSVRMQAPVPGTDTVGVEVPNERRTTVHFREIVENENFRQAKSLLTVALGKDTGGHPVSADLAKMPHLLVAGATGAGKSVCLNAIILSLLYRARPDEVQMILVDPKRVELSMYADLPHLVHPVVTDMDLTKNALLWAIEEMNRRLSLFSKVKVRNITGYNDRQARLRAEVEAGGPVPVDEETGEPEDLSNMPFLVIIVDELADLMMVKRKEVEGSIVRLAQLARAAGIHLIIATQRPSVDVVTGLIKANFPCRIAFKVTSGQDSRTIIDGAGAEKLLGMGDMLFKPNGGMLQRLHGAFVSDEEVSAVVEFWKKQQPPNYKVDFAAFGNDDSDDAEDFGQPASRGNEIVDDPIYAEAVQFVLDNGKVSISLLQRRFRIGFNRAARFVEQMEKDGLLSQADGTRPRSVVHR